MAVDLGYVIQSFDKKSLEMLYREVRQCLRFAMHCIVAVHKHNNSDVFRSQILIEKKIENKGFVGRPGCAKRLHFE